MSASHLARGPLLGADRFLLPAGDARLGRYLAGRLLVAHRRADRAAIALGLARRRLRPVAFEPSELDLLASVLEGDGASLLAGTPLAGAGTIGWILLRDEPTAGRARHLAFLFAPGSARPGAVLKLRPGAGAGSRLEGEGRALAALAERLPAALRASVPRRLAYRDAGGVEALLLDPLEGRSAYADLHRGLAPWRRVRAHFRAASAWLAGFHLATRVAGGERAAVHGDFWPRNLLLRGAEVAGVVDWERFRPEGDPAEDLFHFPLAYALAYPWGPGYRRLAPEEAFRRAFLEPTHLSRAVRGYLRDYAARAGLDPARLRRLLDRELRKRFLTSSEATWTTLAELLARSDRSVFSG